jgi:hypothetical protein
MIPVEDDEQSAYHVPLAETAGTCHGQPTRVTDQSPLAVKRDPTDNRTKCSKARIVPSKATIAETAGSYFRHLQPLLIAQHL